MTDANENPETGTQATVLFDFEGVRDDNLNLTKGEIITIVEMNESGWWTGCNARGHFGIFPYNYVEPRVIEKLPEFRIVKAIADGDWDAEDCLKFETGDLITIIKPIDSDWSLGKLHTTFSDQRQVTERVVGKFHLNYVEETGDVDENGEAEEEAYAEKVKKEKEDLARQLQEERQRVEEERAKAIELEAQRLENEQKRKEELEELKKIQAQKLIQAEEQVQSSRLIRNKEARQKALDEAVALKREQEEKDKAIEAEKAKLEAEMERLKAAMQKMASETEEARKRAQQAENELASANAEKARLKIARENIRSKNDATIMKKKQDRARLVKSKHNESVQNFTRDDGFKTPPPLQQKKPKSIIPARFRNLGKGEKCKVCEKSVPSFGPGGVKAIGASFHVECFTCGSCSKTLKLGGGWLEHGGFPYCTKCHHAGFGIKGFGFGGAVTAQYGKGRN